MGLMREEEALFSSFIHWVFAQQIPRNHPIGSAEEPSKRYSTPWQCMHPPLPADERSGAPKAPEVEKMTVDSWKAIGESNGIYFPEINTIWILVHFNKPAFAGYLSDTVNNKFQSYVKTTPVTHLRGNWEVRDVLDGLILEYFGRYVCWEFTSSFWGSVSRRPHFIRVPLVRVYESWHGSSHLPTLKHWLGWQDDLHRKKILLHYRKHRNFRNCFCLGVPTPDLQRHFCKAMPAMPQTVMGWDFSPYLGWQ